MLIADGHLRTQLGYERDFDYGDDDDDDEA